MMHLGITRVDRYVMRGFVTSLLSMLALISVLYIVLDAFPHLDDFTGAVERSGVFVTAARLVRYYAARILMELGSFGEILAAAAAITVASGMSRANEFVALLAGGMSLRRVVLSLFIGSIVIGIMVFSLRNGAGPALTRRQRADWRQIRGIGLSLGESLSVQGRSTTLGSSSVALSVEQYDPATLSARGFSAAVVRNDGGPFLDVRAPVAVWDRSQMAWHFPEGADQWTYGVAPGTSGGLSRIHEFHTELGPELLEVDELGTGVLSLGALYRQSGRPEFAAAFHQRIAQILAPFILTLTVLPFILLTDKSRVFPGMMLAILMIIAFEVCTRLCAGAAGSGYMPPLLGGWLPLLAFGGFGWWRLMKIST